MIKQQTTFYLTPLEIARLHFFAMKMSSSEPLGSSTDLDQVDSCYGNKNVTNKHHDSLLTCVTNDVITDEIVQMMR